MTRRINGLLGVCLIASLLWTFIDDSRGWRRWAAAAGAADPDRVIQLATTDGKVDRCPTCHRAALGLARPGAKRPHRAHPVIEGHADLALHGCTTCHGGQGRRLDQDAHQPRLGAGHDPFLKQPYLQARCARCHVPTGLGGAADLERGIDEYLRAGCVGCHLPGHHDVGIGPDLRRMGRRTEAELREALLYPERGHPDAAMFNLRWRYDQRTERGRKALAGLITAVLAFSEPRAPFRAAWARPDARIDTPCQSCHREVFGGTTLGARHRCTLLRQQHHLRCKRCHGSAELRPRAPSSRPSARADTRDCPHIAQTRPLCGVCHLRPGDAPGKGS
jgi:hypothetical protein